MTSLPDQARRIRRNRVLRRVGIPVYIAARRRLASRVGPRILINSIPKAGTHLIASMLTRAEHISYSGVVTYHDKYAQTLEDLEGLIPSFDAAQLERELCRVSKGSYVNGHLYWDVDTDRILRGCGYRSVFVTRDPRDILISNVHYIQSFNGHPRHRLMMSQFADFDSRLMALIEGFPATAGHRGLANVGRRLDAFVGWTEHVPTFSFEEFVAPRSDEQLQHSLNRLAKAVGWEAEMAPGAMLEGLGNPWSATFRSGRAGEWRTVFNEAHLEAFDQLAGSQTQALGYTTS